MYPGTSQNVRKLDAPQVPLPSLVILLHLRLQLAQETAPPQAHTALIWPRLLLNTLIHSAALAASRSDIMGRPPKTQEELAAFMARPRVDYQERRRIALENSRLNMMAPTRILLAAVSSFGVGTSLGMAQGSKMAGLQFRAEHAHKLPTTPTGWFMYHKSKNYIMARGALKEGIKMGFKVSFWTTAMFAVEDMYDEHRGSKDFVNTVLASLTVAGGFSLWSTHRNMTSSWLVFLTWLVMIWMIC